MHRLPSLSNANRLAVSAPGVIVALWAWLAATAAIVAVGHMRSIYPSVATFSVAIAAFWGWRVSTGDFVLGEWRQTLKLWWPYLAIIIVGAYVTSNVSYGYHIVLTILSTRSVSGIATLIMGWIVAPICEEALFRGVLLRWLYRRFAGRRPALYAIVISSVAFGATHAVNFVVTGSLLATTMDVASAIAFGLLIGFGYTKTWNLYGAIAAHIIGNVLTVA